jgi:hypothetical protein
MAGSVSGPGVMSLFRLPVVARFVGWPLRGAGGAESQGQEGLRSRAFWIIAAVLFLFSIGQNGAMTIFCVAHRSGSQRCAAFANPS